MKDRYLFRGKRIDTGEWVYGDLLWNNGLPIIVMQVDRAYIGTSDTGFGKHWHIETPAYYVQKETLGMWSGLTDKNGVKIFEGDKIHTDDEDDSREYLLVVFNTRHARFQLDFYGFGMYHNEGGGEEFHNSISLIDENNLDMEFLPEFEIIGNIHDNN